MKAISFASANIIYRYLFSKLTETMAKKTSLTRENTPKKAAVKPPKKEGNAFDKIFKEIIEKIFRPLVEKKLGIKIVKATPLKEKMQTTIELEMDFFLRNCA